MKPGILVSAAVVRLLFLQATAGAGDQPPSGGALQVSVGPESVTTGEDITVTVANSPGSATDYVAVSHVRETNEESRLQELQRSSGCPSRYNRALSRMLREDVKGGTR